MSIPDPSNATRKRWREAARFVGKHVEVTLRGARPDDPVYLSGHVAHIATRESGSTALRKDMVLIAGTGAELVFALSRIQKITLREHPDGYPDEDVADGFCRWCAPVAEDGTTSGQG